MGIVETFTKDTLLKRIEGLNSPATIALNTDTVAVGNPTAVTGTKNTQVMLTGTTIGTEGYEDVLAGTQRISYDRLDLAKLFKGVKLYFKLPDDGSVGSLYAFLPTLSNLSGVALYQEDVNNAVITPNTEKVTLTAKSTSLNVTGKVDITFFVPPVDLSKLKGNLDIFTDSVVVSDLVYSVLGGDKLMPVNAYRLTKDVDFTRYYNELNSIVNVGLTASSNGVSLGRILRNEFGLPIGNITNPNLMVTTKVSGDYTVVTITANNIIDKFEMKYKPGGA